MLLRVGVGTVPERPPDVEAHSVQPEERCQKEEVHAYG
jgi:hypothetical protein